MKEYTRLIFAAFCALNLANAPPMLAQDGEPGSEDPVWGELPVMDISDEELKTYIEVSDEIRQIRRDYYRRLPIAQSNEHAYMMQMNTRAEIASVFQAHGMTMEEYNRLGIRIQTDPALWKRMDAFRGQWEPLIETAPEESEP